MYDPIVKSSEINDSDLGYDFRWNPFGGNDPGDEQEFKPVKL